MTSTSFVTNHRGVGNRSAAFRRTAGRKPPSGGGRRRTHRSTSGGENTGDLPSRRATTASTWLGAPSSAHGRVGGQVSRSRAHPHPSSSRRGRCASRGDGGGRARRGPRLRSEPETPATDSRTGRSGLCSCSWSTVPVVTLLSSSHCWCRHIDDVVLQSRQV